MGIYRGDVFAVDWTDLNAVKRVCNQLGKNCLVIKVPGRPNYNITFVSRKDTYEDDWVVYRPRGELKKGY